MGNEIVAGKASSAGFLANPQNFDEAMRIARVLADSDMVPKDYKGKPQNCLVALQWGADVGLPGLQALQNIAVINGRPSIWGDAALALVQSHPAYVGHREWMEGEGEARAACCAVTRKGAPEHIQRFSVADAKRAALWGKTGPWTQYPDRMMQMRARGFALRDRFADALRGLSIGEESQDIAEVDMGTAERVPAPAAPPQRTEPPRAPALPDYADDRFAENLPTWKDLVAAGRKSGADLAAMLSTKAMLSEAQRAQLLELDNFPPADPAPALTADQSDFVGQMEGHDQ
ncbi:hypothetical protein [Methyloversatilis sp. XJ19-49]|uniref:hypothetical protein n=1 Tax=Methyloversatilis sp. XJ19-49 TaxID=2963429 RepID=UPI00211C70B7|nr:hypothetical protein [Methyloversatilis sp. XJ19-49]MCQ9378836.1 hypothetical protein [Methyloversatilis sp. XJ19-49]